MKRSIIYDRKSMIRSKNQFLKTDQSIMIENQFLIGITNFVVFCENIWEIPVKCKIRKVYSHPNASSLCYDNVK